MQERLNQPLLASKMKMEEWNQGQATSRNYKKQGNTFSPRASRKECNPADTWGWVQRDPWPTSDLQQLSDNELGLFVVILYYSNGRPIHPQNLKSWTELGVLRRGESRTLTGLISSLGLVSNPGKPARHKAISSAQVAS